MSSQSLQQLRSLISGTAECAESLKRAHELKAVEGSQMLAEQETDEVPVGRAYACAFLHLTAAQDHLESISRLMQDEPLTQFGFPVLTRSVLENASRAAWLLDPEIEAVARIGRGLTVWADSLRELAEVHDLTDSGGADSARKGIESAREEAERHGLEIVEINRFGQLAVKDHEMPTASQMAGAVLEHGKTDYKVLSAYTHGTTYALLQNYFKGGPKGNVPTMSLSQLAANISSAVAAFCYAFNLQVQLYGWDQETWAAWSRHALITLQELMAPGLAAEEAAFGKSSGTGDTSRPK